MLLLPLRWLICLSFSVSYSFTTLFLQSLPFYFLFGTPRLDLLTPPSTLNNNYMSCWLFPLLMIPLIFYSQIFFLHPTYPIFTFLCWLLFEVLVHSFVACIPRFAFRIFIPTASRQSVFSTLPPLNVSFP